MQDVPPWSLYTLLLDASLFEQHLESGSVDRRATSELVPQAVGSFQHPSTGEGFFQQHQHKSKFLSPYGGEPPDLAGVKGHTNRWVGLVPHLRSGSTLKLDTKALIRRIPRI